ncbi:hypothetical protein BDZ89DRAFT_1050224 [Hymenopellis radicata]|nr:hypothetical protein BDZ89DRAFT_1050224 [Hymenopellis radicata]
MKEYSMDTARALEDPLPRDLASFTPTQLHSSHAMNVYPSLPISAERTLEYAPDPPTFAPTNDFPAVDLPNIERVTSDRQSEFDREYPGGNPFVFEELNWDSEEDSESASYVELDGARALNRIAIIFHAVEKAIFHYAFTVTDIRRDMIWGVLADLLKDGKVWLWVDGDEEEFADLQWGRELKGSLKYVERKLSCSLALRLRKPRSPTWSNFREQVSKVSFAMRVSVITWATFTSLSVREAGWERGRSDWTRCELLHATSKWDDVLNALGIRDLLVDESRHSHLKVAFKDTLRCHGHSCYYSQVFKYSKEPLKLLSYMLSFLYSTPLAGKDVSMIFFEDEFFCQQCVKLKKLYITNNDAPGHIPPLSLLVLNKLRPGLEIDTAAWLRILALSVSRGFISAAILTKMDDEIRMHLGTDVFDFEYQPWVNRLPGSLRFSVVTCSDSEWREAELAVRRENQHESVPTSQWDSLDTTIGLGVWITGIYLLMSEHSSQKLTPLKYWSYSYQCASQYSFDNAMLRPTFCSIRNRSMYRYWNRFGVQCPANTPSAMMNVTVGVIVNNVGNSPKQNPLFLSKSRRCRDMRKIFVIIPPIWPTLEPFLVKFVGQIRQISVGPVTVGGRTIFPAQVPTLTVVQRNSPVSISVSQIPSTSGQSRASTLPKDVILPKLKTHFAKLLAQHDIPIQYTNLGAPQLPWCTLPELLRNRRLEIAGWPEDLRLPDATGKHNAKGIMGLTAKEARRLHEVLPGISFRQMDKSRARPREEESEDDILGNPPTKKVKGKGKAPAEGEKKFRLSEVQTVIRGIHVGKYTQ